MHFSAADLDALLAVVAAVLDEEGVLLEANAGFLRLLPEDGASPVGTMAARFFIQPAFSELLATREESHRASYLGLMTIGDYLGRTRTLNGRVWRTASGIRVLAEYDIAEIEKLNEVILDMNRQASDAQNTLARANLALKHREAQSAAAALTDVLTGLGNRRRLDQALEIEISRAARTGGTLSAIMADVDHFKRVNDVYGHGVGDRVLARFGALLRSTTRSTDIVARFGGEEFVVLMPLSGLDQAADKAEQLRSALAAERIEPLADPVTSSFGVVEMIPGEGGAALLHRLDAALYRAKEGGRNRVVAAGNETRRVA